MASPQPSPASPSSPNPEEDETEEIIQIPQSLPSTIWSLTIPLQIHHSSLPSSHPPFFILLSRLSYLPLLSPRLSTYFGGLASTTFYYDSVLLRNLPVGLLHDLYCFPESSGVGPWKIEVGEGEEWKEDVIGDTFLNSAKEADYIRNGNARGIMGLSKNDVEGVWEGVKDGDWKKWEGVYGKLIRGGGGAGGEKRNCPVRVYVPGRKEGGEEEEVRGEYRVVQGLVGVRGDKGSVQTLGSALKSLLPTLFPSSRDPVLANVILHGAPVPFRAPLEELMRECVYPDGWLNFVVVLL
ncbi:putative autophagy protein 5 protein [Podospora fimiseda]|uniref:Autophagy protein 5 n=1 Tax=Podospora fimiseda TaxID=252190 RepID=A0AAN7H6V1_9PEZI|nr:putative autophagy protein 5 protein [Podospora fimiseda]